jgi:hypothetical protein
MQNVLTSKVPCGLTEEDSTLTERDRSPDLSVFIAIMVVE